MEQMEMDFRGAETVRKWSLSLVREDETEWPDEAIADCDGLAECVKKLLKLDSRPAECFGVLALDIKNHVIGSSIVSQGIINKSLIDPRIVFQFALLCNAVSVALAHNHPSGNPEPSQADINVTRRLKEAGDLMGVKVLDHIVIGLGGRSVSMRQRQLI